MKNTLRIIYFSFCFIIFSVAIAQAQTVCSSTPEVTVVGGTEATGLSKINISDCEWNRREIFIAAPETKQFIALNKTLKKMEEKRRGIHQTPYRVKFNDTDLNLYRIDLNRQTVSLVLAQDLTRIRAANIREGQGLNIDRVYSLQAASPGVTFESQSKDKKSFYIKVGGSVGPAFSVNTSTFDPTAEQFPTLGIRTNLKVLINF